MGLSRWSKIWIVITLLSLLLYDTRWLYGVFNRLYQGLVSADPIGEVLRYQFWVDYVLTGVIGDGIRLAAVILALISAYLVWGPRQEDFPNVKKNVARAILFEGIYFLTLLPLSIIGVIRGGSAPVLLIAFIMQILMVSPVLIVLSRKVSGYTEAAKANVIKWSCIAGVVYLAGIWLNNVCRGFSKAASAGLSFLLAGISSLGVLSTVITLALSLVFAVAGAYVLLKKDKNKLSIRLFALALIMLGLHFVIFIVYSAITSSLNFVWLTEIWPITLLGLGIGMIRGKV